METWKGSFGWMQLALHFGTENREEKLRKTPCILEKIESESLPLKLTTLPRQSQRVYWGNPKCLPNFVKHSNFPLIQLLHNICLQQSTRRNNRQGTSWLMILIKTILWIQVSEGKDAPKCGNFLLTTPERLFNTMYNTSALHQYNLEYILPHTNTYKYKIENVMPFVEACHLLK